MPSDLAVADAVTKIGYEDIHDQLDNFIVALQLVERGSKHINFTNTEVQFAARMGRSQGIGARDEYEPLPNAGNAKDARASMFLKYHYGRVQGTAQVFTQVQTNTASFVDWMQREMTDIIESLRRDHNRQVYGDGTGALAFLSANATNATSLTVDDVHWLEEDMLIDVLTAATLTNPVPTSGIVSGTILKILTIDTTTNIITVSGGTATALIGSAIVRGDYAEGARQNNWNKEWLGLGALVATGEYLNIDPTTYPKWLPGYVESSVGTLAEMDLTHLAQGIHQKGGKVTDYLTTYGVVNAYWNQLQGLRRYDGNDSLKGGATKPVFQSVFGDIPITPDWACPEGELYALNKGEMYLHQLADWKWEDKTGAIWQQVPNRHAWNATVFQFSNLGAFRRNTFGKLSGITEV